MNKNTKIQKLNEWSRNNPIKFLFIGIVVIFICIKIGLFIGSNLGSGDINGSIIENSYVGSTSVSLNSGDYIMWGQFEYILYHVWNIVRNNSNINSVDINFVITGNDGYGNIKTSNWCHLIFNEYEINLLRKYTNLGSMDWIEKSNLLDNVGMYKLKDYKGDLSKDVFQK